MDGSVSSACQQKTKYTAISDRHEVGAIASVLEASYGTLEIGNERQLSVSKDKQYRVVEQASARERYQ